MNRNRSPLRHPILVAKIICADTVKTLAVLIDVIIHIGTWPRGHAQVKVLAHVERCHLKSSPVEIGGRPSGV